MKKKRVGVKFCGNCNPQAETTEILQQIKATPAGRASEFVPWDRPDLNMLIVLSGCPVDCAARPPGQLPSIVVAGESVNLQPCAQDRIAGAVALLLSEQE